MRSLRQARRLFRQIIAGLAEALAMRAATLWDRISVLHFVLQQFGVYIVGWEQREAAGCPLALYSTCSGGTSDKTGFLL